MAHGRRTQAALCGALMVACVLLLSVNSAEAAAGSGQAGAGLAAVARRAAASSATRRLLGSRAADPDVSAADGGEDEEAAPEPDPLPEPAGPPSAQDLEVLNMMNRMRAKHGAPPLKWDARLAAGAEYYAGGCPKGHSGARGLGENMAWGAPDWKAALQQWYDESKKVDWSNLGWNAEAFQFTQMVWRTSKEAGCAVNRDCAEGGPVYVCYFSPAGNVIGVNWRRQVRRASQAATNVRA